MSMRLGEDPGADSGHQVSGRHQRGSGGADSGPAASRPSDSSGDAAADGARARLLRDMLAALGTRGAARIEIDGLARAAGSDPVAIRHWFRDLNQTLVEALRSTEEELNHQLNAALAAIPDAPRKLAAVIEVSVAETNWPLWMQLESRALHDEELRVGRQELEEAWRARLARIIRAGREDGSFTSVNPDEAAMMITGMIDGLCASMSLKDSKLTTNHVLQICFDACEQLLGARLEFSPQSEA